MSSSLDHATKFVRLLREAPRTPAEVKNGLRCTRNTAYRVLNSFLEAKLVRFIGFVQRDGHGPRAAIYEWIP